MNYIVKYDDKMYPAPDKLEAQRMCCALIINYYIVNKYDKRSYKDVVDLVQAGRPLEAIKQFRLYTGIRVDYYQMSKLSFNVDDMLNTINVKDILE